MVIAWNEYHTILTFSLYINDSGHWYKKLAKQQLFSEYWEKLSVIFFCFPFFRTFFRNLCTTKFVVWKNQYYRLHLTYCACAPSDKTLSVNSCVRQGGGRWAQIKWRLRAIFTQIYYDYIYTDTNKLFDRKKFGWKNSRTSLFLHHPTNYRLSRAIKIAWLIYMLSFTHKNIMTR